MAPLTATQETNEAAQPDFLKPSILVVDDENRIRQVCMKMLLQEGFDAAQAENSEAGLEMIAKRHFDIILLDLMMPGMPGLEALEHIRALHPDTLVIVITGYATLDHAVDAMKNGAFDFISKPFSPGDLRFVINKAIENIRTLRDIANEKSRMHALVNQLADGVMATDARRRIALANHAFLDMVNYCGPLPIGRPVESVVQDGTILSMLDKALSMDEDAFSEVTEELHHKRVGEEAERILGARCIPFLDRLRRKLGTITVLHDITALKKIDQMKSDFVSMVSHEIRSPLNSILMQLKVVLDGLAGEVTAKQTELLMRASKKIEALVTLSQELLDLSKMESGLINLDKKQLDLAPLLTEQLALYQPQAQAGGITLELTPLPDLPAVMANKMNMEEVLSNLISNALRYTQAHGQVVVSAGVDGHYVCIRVSDNGFGIAPEDLERIFHRFYRVKNEKTRQIIGTGLGLPIVKSIVEAHHGRIHVESQVNVGSTFSVLIPISNGADPP